MATGIAAGLGAGAFGGLTFVAPLVVGGFSALDFMVGRFVACGLFPLAWLAWVHGRSAWRGAAEAWPTGAQMGAALGLSVLGYTGYYWLLVLAIEDAGAALPVLIIGTIPLWVMLLGKPHSLRWRHLLPGMALTALGVAAGLGALLLWWIVGQDTGVSDTGLSSPPMWAREGWGLFVLGILASIRAHR